MNQNYDIIEDPNVIVKVEFDLESEKMNIERTAYKLTDLSGDIGGIYSGITIVMALLLGSYSETSFIISANRKLN